MGVPETLLEPWRDSSTRGPTLRVRKMTAAPQTKGLETYWALVQPKCHLPRTCPLFFCWRITALQCCVSFFCTRKKIRYMYTYIRDTGDMGSNPGSGRSLGGGNGNPLQYSCLENPMEPTVHRVAKSWTRLSTHSIYIYIPSLWSLPPTIPHPTPLDQHRAPG